MHRIDGPGHIGNQFTEGNPTTGTPATEVTADILNALQEEVAAVIEGAGLALIKADNAQLLEAIGLLIAGGGEPITAEGVSIADAGGYFAGANVELALQQLGLAVLSGTIVTSRLRRSIIPLTVSGQTETAHAEAFVEITSVSDVNYTVRPDSALNLPIGTAIEVAQGGAGKVTFVAGAGVTIKKCALFELATLGQDAIGVLVKVAANTWRLGGMLEAA